MFTRRLTFCGFSRAQIVEILKGSKCTSVKILNAITMICVEEVAKVDREKTLDDIVDHVRQGRKDTNRKAVATAFLQRGCPVQL